MFDIGAGEIFFILLVVIIMFGPKKLPELAQMIGKGMQKFKAAQAEMQVQVQNIQAEMKANLEVDNPNVIKPAPRRDQILAQELEEKIEAQAQKSKIENESPNKEEGN